MRSNNFKNLKGSESIALFSVQPVKKLVSGAGKLLLKEIFSADIFTILLELKQLRLQLI